MADAMDVDGAAVAGKKKGKDIEIVKVSDTPAIDDLPPVEVKKKSPFHGEQGRKEHV